MFHEFALPEYNWNFVDQVLCGYYDQIPDTTKCRRIRYCIIPPEIQNQEQEQHYIKRFNKWVEYLQTRIFGSSKSKQHSSSLQEPISVHIPSMFTTQDDDPVHSNPNPTSGASPLKSQQNIKQSTREYKVNITSSSNSSRKEWLILQLDSVHDTLRCFQFELRWLSCSGVNVEDFTTSFSRKCHQYNLELRRVPEFARATFLQLHPLLTPIFLPLPSHFVSSKSFQHEFLKRFEFVFDEERITGNLGLGIGLGIGSNADSLNDTKPTEDKSVNSSSVSSSIPPPSSNNNTNNNANASVVSSQASKPTTTSSSSSSAKRTSTTFRRKKRMTVETMMEIRRTRGYRQYVHRKQSVFVRFIHNGLVWIPSYSYQRDGSLLSEAQELLRQVCDYLDQVLSTKDLIHDIVDTVVL